MFVSVNIVRKPIVTGNKTGGGGCGGDDASSSPSSTPSTSEANTLRRGGGGSRGGKRGDKKNKANAKKKIQTGEALFDHYTGEFEFDAAQTASGDNSLHPLLGGRTPADLLHDVISFSPVFRGFGDRRGRLSHSTYHSTHGLYQQRLKMGLIRGK